MRAIEHYPYYIVQWQEGRLPCPREYRMVGHIRRQFETGHIGGRRNVECETGDPKEAQRIWNRNRQKHNIAVYVVDRPNAQRRRIMQPYTLNAPVKEKKMQDLFTATQCDRCGNPLPVRTMSWFTTETICMDCSKAEGTIKTRLREMGIEDAMEGCGYVPDPDKVKATH